MLSPVRLQSLMIRAENNASFATNKKMVACRREWDMHINRKVDAAADRGDQLVRMYRGYYYRIATDCFEDLPESYQM